MKHKTLAMMLLLLSVLAVGFAQNNALYFDGVDDSVVIGSMTSSITTSYTAEAWFNPATLANLAGADAVFGRTIFASSTTSDKPLWVSHVGQNILVRTFTDNNPVITYDAGLVVGNWYHIAVTAVRSGTTILYINGVQVASASSGTQSVWNTTFTIGDIRPGRGLTFNGLIDEVRVWNVVRTPAQIQDNWDTEVDPASAGLVGYWKLNETSGTVAYDSSLPANDGTVMNDESVHPSPQWVDGNPTLPVELSIFTATFTVTNFVTLHWVSQSETGVSGYYLYRSQDNNLVNAIIVSPMIPATNTADLQSYSFQDNGIYEAGEYYYWLQSIDYDGSYAYHGPTSVQVNYESESPLPEIQLASGLLKVYPNPFSLSTAIVYGMEKSAPVNIKIYNTRGQLIRQYHEGEKSPNTYQVFWDGLDQNGRECPTGIYLIRMQAGSQISDIKALLQK